jgi:heterodisulfide reductase subunit A
MTRIGIFLCACDQKINKSIDVDAVENALRETPDLMEKPDVWAMPHVCLPDGTRDLRNAIVEHGLERVVVAACPARFQEKHLRAVCVSAGVNVTHFALVDWREGCAWAHRGDKPNATAKAIDLARMGVARVANANALDGVMTKIEPRVLVIGGGIAGMTAARTLADRGVAVFLVEQQAQLGGQLRGVALDGAAQAYNATLDAVMCHPHIRLRLNSRIVAVDGAVGDYRVEICHPDSAETINAGAVIVATGAQEFRPVGLFGYDGRRVVTLGEFEAHVSRITCHVSRAVYILCAGSRNEKIAYCSNVCCLAALNQAIRVKHAKPDTHVTILFRDLYLLGDDANEQVVREARRAGIEFVRYAPSHPPRVGDDFVAVRDELTGQMRRIEYDRVVLATPRVPREDAGVIARWLCLARDDDGFFPDPHWRLRPEQQSARGIFICGSAHRPVDVDTAIMQGMTAAARAARFIQSREILRPALSARVNEQICTGCAQCVEACALGAIRLTPLPLPPLPSPERSSVQERGEGGRGVRSEVDPFLCVACGNCVVACPSKAIEMPNPSDAQILAQIDAASSCHPVLVFACQWSGLAAMELAGARRMKYSAHARVIELPCSARLDPLHVLYAFVNGAKAVILALCPPNECHFGNGNRYAEARIENLRAQLAAHEIDPQRLQIARMMGDDAGAWVRALTEIGAGRKAAVLSASRRMPSVSRVEALRQ